MLVEELQDLELDRTRDLISYLPLIDGHNFLTPLIRTIMGLQSQADIYTLYSPYWWPSWMLGL